MSKPEEKKDDFYDGFDEFEDIPDETNPKPVSPKKVDPPPKPAPPPPPVTEGQKLNDEMNRTAKTVKSIVKLKAELGPVTEEVKAEIEHGMVELKQLVKSKRDMLLTLFMERNKEDYREIRDSIELNRVYLDMDADPTTGESSRLKRMTKVNESNMLTFKGFVDTLRAFEYSADEKIIKHIVDKLRVYDWRLDQVHFYRFIREVTRFTAARWDLVTGRKILPDLLREPIDKARVANFIKQKFKKFIENRKVAPQPGKKRERNQEVDFKDYTSKEMVEKLQQEYILSGVDLKLQVDRVIQTNGSELITHERFRDVIYNQLKFEGLSRGFIELLFKRLDPCKHEKVNIKHMLTLLFSENKHGLLDLPENGEELMAIVSEAARHQYTSESQFVSACRHSDQSKISFDEFYIFVTSFSRLKNKQALVLFNYLDDSRVGTLQDAHLMALWEYMEKIEKAKEDKLEKSRDDDRMKSQFDISGFGPIEEMNPQFAARGRQSSLIDGGLMDRIDDAPIDAIQDFSSNVPGHGRLLANEVEELVMKMSIQAININRSHGKTLKELFLMFASKVVKTINFDGLMECAQFLNNNHPADEDVLKSLYTMIAQPQSKKITLSSFLLMIDLGRKVNGINIKLRNRYGVKLLEAKPFFEDELNKLSIKRGDGFVPLVDVRRMFAKATIDVTDLDCENLKEDGILIQKDRLNVIDVARFLDKMFQEQSAFTKYFRKQAALKILRRWREFKKRKLRRIQEEHAINNLFGGVMNESSPTRKVSPKQKTKALPRKTKIITKSPEERMFTLLPDPKSQPMTVQAEKTYKIAEKIIADILEKVVMIGENNLLKKNVKRRFANRSVNKDNIVMLQEETFGVSNVLPRSISSMSSVGRIFYLTHDAMLHQYDLTTGQMLPEVDLSSKIPMKKDEILDYLLDAESGILYILKVSWILEAWNIFQKSKFPAAKIRVVLSNEGLGLVNQAYKNRYLGAFPSLLSLSQNSRQYLLVNCTCVNGTIYFLDPTSLSVLNQSRIKNEELSISSQLNRIFFALKQPLANLPPFEKLFANDIRVDANKKFISANRFKKFIMEDLNMRNALSMQDIDELTAFLDIDEDLTIDDDEWMFFNELVRLTIKKSTVHASYEIPEQLRNIDRTVAKVFYDVYEFVQKKNIPIEDLFLIFDSNNSGFISESEFLEIMSEISKETNLDVKRKFFKFIDKDNSKTVDIKEFVQIFKLFGNYSPQELLPSEEPRTDLYSIIEKAFDHGIDMESEMVKLDVFKDGGIEPYKFRTLLKSLPFGVTDDDVNFYIDKTFQFTNDGSINYLDIFGNERYKRVKYIYQIKRGFKGFDNKLKDSEEVDKFLGTQKIVCETIIHLSSENVFIFTVTSPKTSTIFVARTRENKNVGKALGERFEAQLLARLRGHNSKEPPTIIYVSESGCLVSADKLPIVKETIVDTGAQSKMNDNFSRFYSNITSNKTRTANILIWKLSKELFTDNTTSPPWKLNPTRVIENAHYDSIICLTYMPLSQLIVSTSVDGSIKMWDPISRPHSLVHKDALQKTKTGLYFPASEESTKSNTPFAEVYRFYTGELTCYSLICQYQRVPVSESDGVPKFRNLEYLISMELGKAQRSAGKLRTEGVVKIFGVERLTMEIPVSRYEEVVPKQLMTELIDLAISNRQSTKFQFKRNLSLSLDKIMSKVVIQKTELAKISQLLKGITLDRYNNRQESKKYIELFDLLVHLPMRNTDSHQRMLSIDEIHMYLKKNGYLFPSNMSKEAFVAVVEDLIQKSSHYLVDHRSKKVNKFLNSLSSMISKKDLDIDGMFSKEVYTRTELKRIFESLAQREDDSGKLDAKRLLEGMGDKEDDIEELLTELDPFYSNSIRLEAIKTYFSSEIISAKINEFARPNVIISQINAKLSRSNKVELLRNLFSADSQGIGRVKLFGFLQSFAKLSRTIDENTLKELFSLMSETDDIGEQFIDLSYFCKKLLTHSEQFELARVYNALGKIKNSLRFRLKSVEDLFIDDQQEFKGKSVQNLTVKVSQFEEKVKDMDIVGLSNRDVSLISNFLSSIDEDGNSCISLLNLNAYFKKIDLKYQFTELGDYKRLIKELKKIIANKEEFTRKWTGVCNRELIGFGEMRILLNYFNIDEDIVDLILLKFVEHGTSSVGFFNKLNAFVEMNSYLEDTKNLKAQNASIVANKIFQEQAKQTSANESQSTIDKPRDSMDDLIELMEKYESKKTIMSAFNVCKKFDSNNTGRVNVADFVNILWYNLELSKHPESESVRLRFEHEMIITNNMKTIEYSELFDRLESKRAARLTKANTEQQIVDKSEIEISLPKIIAQISESIRHSNFNLDKALNFFDRDNIGLITQDNFRKIIRWTKSDLSDEEMLVLEDNLMFENAINYRKLLDLLEINDKHINVVFDADIWFTVSKNISLDIIEKLNLTLEYLRYWYTLKKDANPLVSAAMIEQQLHENNELTASEIESVLKYAVIGSTSTLAEALNRMQASNMRWEFEYVHMPHFLASVPIVAGRKRELPENKDTNRTPYGANSDETEKNHIISKVKAMLRDRGVTMFESLMSSSSDFIEGSKINKSNFLRVLKMIDLDLTMKEKVLILKVLDPAETGKIDLHMIMSTFEPGNMSMQKGVQDKFLLEKFIYAIYYGGHSLGSAFDVMVGSKIGMMSAKDFTDGTNKIDLNLSVFECNKIVEILGLTDPYIRISKSDFRRTLKKLMKKYGINPTMNFSFSLFAQIKNLIEKKNKNLLECFVEEDLHKSRHTDLEMLKRALMRFGLTNIKIHEIKTLVKYFTKDVNTAPDDELESDDDEEVGQNQSGSNLNMTLDLVVEKPKKVDEKKKKFDINSPDFSIDYDEFVRKILEEVQNNSEMMIRGAYSSLHKIYNLTRRNKGFSIFDAFVYFDVNNENLISNMQLRIGLQNLNIYQFKDAQESLELQGVWNVMEKNKDNKVSFSSFLNAFMNAGCIKVISFDEKITKILKKFCFLISKKGNLEEVFKKFDVTQNGSVRLDEFTLQCEKLNLDFKEDELTAIFRTFCNPETLNSQLKVKRDADKSHNDSRQEEKIVAYRAFNFKNFVAVVSFFRKKDQLLKLMHRFDSLIREKGLSYQKIFDDYFMANGKTIKPTAPTMKGGKLTKGEAKSLNMTELKALLKNLKLSFTVDELNLLCDAFEVETINAKTMETIINSVVQQIEKEKNDKAILFQRIAKEIEYNIQVKNSNLQKVFFEFDSRSDGSLRLDELNQMLSFLRVTISKTEVKQLFEEIDYDKKGAITIKEFQSFIDQTYFNKQKKEETIDSGAKNSALDSVIKALQEAAIQKQTSLERIVQSQKGIEMNQVVSIKMVEKVFKDMGCVLKRDEVKSVIDAASKGDSCSWSELVDWGIKNNIDFRTKEKVFSQFPPAVQVILSKILQVFKKLNLSIETAFKYFVKDGKLVSMRNDFLALVQGLEIPATTEEELISLYNFFDERNYGEVTKAAFIEKCEIARDFYKWSDNLPEASEKKGLITLTLRQQVITLLEKLYVSFLEKNYNKKQIFAVFDQHSNGLITREEFTRVCDNLGMPIPDDYRTSLLNFIDPTESQIISLTTLINKMEESVPDHAKDSLKFSQAQTILRDIIGKLQVHTKKFLTELLDLEKKLQLNDILARSKTGIPMYDFYRVLASYGIRLQEGDKMIMNAAFKNPKMPDYFDSENLYLSLDKITSESGLLTHIETENLEAWESGILRRVADRLRSMNLSLDKAFSNIHSSNLGFITIVDFKQLLFSLDINLSQKDVDLLIKRLTSSGNPNVISLEDFKQRFWACFFEGKTQLNPLNLDSSSRQVAALLLHKIRFEMNMPLSVAWDKLDRRKVGSASIEDLRDFLLEIKLPITKEHLGNLFTLIDQGQDSMIDQFEFVEFWNQNLAADFESKKKKVKKFEGDVLGQIAKKINLADKDLLVLLEGIKNPKSDYLDERQLSELLKKVGLSLGESTIRDIIALINTTSPDRVSISQLETALLRNGLRPRDRRDDSKVDFNDKVLISFLNSLNMTANKLKVKVPLMVRDFDEDYDGLLSTNEFYNLIRSLERPFKMDEIQRLANLFASSSSPNKIMIDSIIQAQSRQEKLESPSFDDLCDADSFKAVLERFDPTLLLFKQWSKLKQAKIRFEKHMEQNKDQFRGLQLVAMQYKLKQLKEKMNQIQENIKLVLQSLKNTSTQTIRDAALIKWIDPAHCSLTMNKKEQQLMCAKQDGYVINEYSSSQQFNMMFDTAKRFNRFVTFYRSTLLAEKGILVETKVYPSDTLRRISKDGKFYEDHLVYTLKLQALMSSQYPDMFAKIFGYYSRKMGVDPKEKDIYVFSEILDPEEWISLRDFVNSTGGLIRVPFLVTSNSLFHVIKYWFYKILAIVDVLNQNAACAYVLRPENIYVNRRTLEVKLITLSGAARITHEGTIGNLTDLNIILPHTVKDEEKFNFFKEENFMDDPYLAPEFFYADINERTAYIDSWALGAILYLLIFGEDPQSRWKKMPATADFKNTKEPSEYYNYDIFPEPLVNEILKFDFGIDVDPSDSLIGRSIKIKSFEGAFSKIAEKYNPTTDQSKDSNQAYSVGSFLDVIQLLMAWKPHERPTAKSLLYSKLFKSDKYQEMQMRQFSSLSFFYRSPSKCVRKDILLPLRAMCATIIAKPSKIVALTDDILKVIDRIQACTNTVDSASYQLLSEEFSKGKRVDDLGSSALLDSITFKVRQSENKRLKLPNYSLVKFMFENYVLDLLLFAVLRHHSAVNDSLALDEIPAQKLEEHYYRPIKGFAAILKKMVFELNSYESACSPYVSSIMDILVKFTIGEEFCLASDLVDALEKESNIVITTNTLPEYAELSKQSTLFNNKRFFSLSSAEPDFLDKCWTESVSRKPYCFWSNHWSFYLCTLASSLMREAFGDAGLGSATHPVIFDYIKFTYQTRKKPTFEAESSIGFFNSILKGQITKTADYYSEILILSNNMISLEDPNVGTTSLKVIVNYVMTILKAKNLEKVRAVLDSRVFLKCIAFLQTEDVHLKETILELIYEASLGFNRDHLYLFEQYDVNSKFDRVTDIKPRSAEEIQRNFGLVAHLAMTSEDKMDKQNYVNCVRNYFALNAKVCEKYIRQICLAIAVPSFFVSITTILKSNAEILRNKTHCLEILHNLTNAPFGLLRLLAHGSIDSLPTLGKLFVVNRSGKKNKLNEYLLPYAMKVFKNFLTDARRDVLKLFENTVGLRTLLREQNLVIPKRQTLALLTSKIDEVDVFFKNYFKEMINEANMLTVSRYTGSGSRVKTDRLAHFESVLRECCVKIVCWLNYESVKTNEYSIALLQDITWRFIDNIKFYFESMMAYYQTNESITNCMITVTNFLETITNLGFEFLIFDTVHQTQGIANLEWIMLQVYNIYNYHQILGIHEKPEEGEKLLEFKINKIQDMEERARELVKFIQGSGCLVKYSNCRIAQSAHSLMRILMTVIELNDDGYNKLLETTHFVYTFSSLMQKQYSMLQMFIRTKTESIHVISRYVEESNLRIRIFEALLKCNSEQIKQELLESQTVQRIVNTLLMSKTELDVSFYRSNYKFIVFRNFLPFRAEALSLISLIFWYKKDNERIYNELINEIIKSNSLRLEMENMRQKKNRLLKLSAIAFFSRLLHSEDNHISYLLRDQGIVEALNREFQEDRELIPLFRDTYKFISGIESAF